MIYTVRDLLGTLVAVLVFPLFLVLPGYVLGYLLNLATFRNRPQLHRLLLSLPLSVALTPVVVYLLGTRLSMAAVWPFYGLIWVAFLMILWDARLRTGGARSPGRCWPRALAKPVVIISAVWIAVVALSLVDIQSGHKLFFSVVSYDYTVRSSVISQLGRTQWLPPSNPFFFPGHPAPFRYHYFWFLICSLPVHLFPTCIQPRPALFASVVWIGFTLLATVALYLRLFVDHGERLVRRRTMMAFGLMCLSGLDIVPILFLDFTRSKAFAQVYPTVDWWNADQVTGWLDCCLWVPHHLSGLIACMTGFLILWIDREAKTQRVRWQVVVGAGLAFASAGGLSVYVAFVFAAFLAVWTLLAIIRRQQLEAITLICVGITAAVLGYSFIRDLASAGVSGTTGSHASFMKLGIRKFEPGHMLLFLLHRQTAFWLRISDLVLLPINYLFELGALFVVAAMKIRQWWRSEVPFSPADLASAMMLSVALIVCTFVRSNTILNNDLGIRGMLIVQFILVLWGADILVSLQSPDKQLRGLDAFLRAALVATILTGAATNLYELLILRTYTMLTEAGLGRGTNIINPGNNFGASSLANRELYEYLDIRIPRAAVEQQNPSNQYDPLPGLYSNRQMAMADVNSASAFGGDPSESEPLKAALLHLFGAESTPAEVDFVCRKYKIDFLIARSNDPAWRDRGSWVWTRKPLHSNALARAFACKAE